MPNSHDLPRTAIINDSILLYLRLKVANITGDIVVLKIKSDFLLQLER